jgi:hypothetical protein
MQKSLGFLAVSNLAVRKALQTREVHLSRWDNSRARASGALMVIPIL